MAFEITISALTTTLIIFMLPTILIVLGLLLYMLHYKFTVLGKNQILGWLIAPPPINPILSPRKALHQDKQDAKRSRIILAQVGYRIAIFLVLACFVFVAMVYDLIIHEGGHGLIGQLFGAEWTEIHVGLFYGWTRVTPVISPLDGLVYYQNQAWLYAGGIILEFIMGSIFLLLLLIPPIRKSFFATMFIFTCGIAFISSPLHAWFSESRSMITGSSSSTSDTARFLQNMSMLGVHISPQAIMDIMTGLMILIQLLIIGCGSILWRSFYPQHRFSHVWFLTFIELVWWMHLFLRI